MRIRIAKQTLYKKMVAYITLLVIFIILVLSGVLYVNFENIGLKTQFNSNLSILSQISYSANYLDETARNVGAYIYSSNDYVPLLYSESEDMQDIYPTIRSMEALVSQSGSLHSIYIYNGSMGIFYSTWGGFFSRAEDFADRDIADLIQNNKLPAEKSFKPALRKIPPENGSGRGEQYTNVLTYMIYDYFGDGKRVQSAIIINLSSEYLTGLTELLNTKSILKGSETFILNEKGMVIGGANEESEIVGESKSFCMEKVFNATEKNGYFFDNINGEKVVVTYVASDIPDWRFVNITPYSEIFKDMDNLRRNIYVVCISLLILGMSVSYSLARYLYSPIRNMMRRVEQLSDTKVDKSGINEMDFVTGVLADTVEKARLMQSIKLEKDIDQKNKFLKSLLFNEEQEECYLKETLEKHRINLDTGSEYMLCNCGIDRYGEFSEKFGLEDQKLFRFAVCNAASEIASKYFRNEAIEVDDKNIVILMSIKNTPACDVQASILKIGYEIQEWCGRYLNIGLTIAVSHSCHSLIELPGEYRFAEMLSKHRLIHGHRAILLPHVAESLNKSMFEHPAALEQRLEEAVAHGRASDACESYRSIISYVSEYSCDTISSYMFYLSYLLFKKANELEAKGYERIPLDCNTFISHIISLETLEEIDEKFIKLLETIAHTVENKKFKRKNKLIDKVIEIIEAEYMDKSLCQEVVAGKLDISRDYLGRIFRESYSKSFAEYLTDMRLQKAVEFLSQGKNVTEILGEIGWENKNYFYTTFKQKYGMTTSEYKARVMNV